MKGIGSLALAILIGIVALWLFVKLLGFALKLVAVLIAVAVAVVAFFLVERMVKGSAR